MTFYLIIYVVSALLTVFGILKKIEPTIFLVPILFSLCIFSGLRGLGSSPDDYNYYYSLYYSEHQFEPLYDLLERINIMLFHSSICLQFVMVSFLSLFFLFLSLRKHREISLPAILIYMSHVFLYRDMIQIRAAISYNLVLLMFVIVNSNNYIYKSIFLYTSSILFHFSAFFSSICVFVKNYELSWRKYCTMLFFAFAISFFGVKNILLGSLSIIPDSLMVYADAYLFDNEGYAYSQGLFNPVIFKAIFVSFLVQCFSRQLRGYFGSNLYQNLYFVSLLILLLFNDFAVFSGRLASLFSSVDILLLPALVVVSDRYRWLMLIVVILLTISTLMLDLFIKNMLLNYSSDFIGWL